MLFSPLAEKKNNAQKMLEIFHEGVYTQSACHSLGMADQTWSKNPSLYAYNHCHGTQRPVYVAGLLEIFYFSWAYAPDLTKEVKSFQICG